MVTHLVNYKITGINENFMCLLPIILLATQQGYSVLDVALFEVFHFNLGKWIEIL